MPNKFWFLLTILLFVCKSVYSQQPVSLELQSKAGEKILGTIADPITDSYINPAMMDFEKPTIYSGARFTRIEELDNISQSYFDQQHLYIFIPYKSWSFGIMADKIINTIYFDTYYYENPNLDHINEKYVFSISKKLSTNHSLGLSLEYQKRNNTYDEYNTIYNYTGNEYILDPLYKIQGDMGIKKLTIGGKLKFKKKLYICPSFSYSLVNKELYNNQYTIRSKSNYIYNYNDFYVKFYDSISYNNDNYPAFNFPQSTFSLIGSYNIHKNIKTRFWGNYNKLKYTETAHLHHEGSSIITIMPQDSIEYSSSFFDYRQYKNKSIQTLAVGIGIEFNIFNRINNYISMTSTNYDIQTIYQYDMNFFKDRPYTKDQPGHSSHSKNVDQISYGLHFRILPQFILTYAMNVTSINGTKYKTKNIDWIGFKMSITDSLAGNFICTREFYNTPSFYAMQFKLCL